METLEERRRNNDILYAYDLIKKKIKCDELCNKIIFIQPAPQNLRRRRPLYVDIRRRNYTFLETLNRVATRFNGAAHMFDDNISRNAFLKKLRNIYKNFSKFFKILEQEINVYIWLKLL